MVNLAISTGKVTALCGDFIRLSKIFFFRRIFVMRILYKKLSANLVLEVQFEVVQVSLPI